MGPRRTTQLTFGTIVLFLALVAGILPAGRAGATREARPREGRWVSVTTGPGGPRRVVRQYLGRAELGVVSRLDSMVRTIPLADGGVSNLTSVRWVTEVGIETSVIASMQRRVLDTLAAMVAASGSMPRDWPVTVIVARTQEFIRASLAQASCHVDGRPVLMGATVCGRHVIVSNLTGFLHLDSPDHGLTPELESSPEKPVSTTPRHVVLRSAAGLAHEFVHVWRAAVVDGGVRDDEPKWFAEGLAEFWSGVAAVRSSVGSGPYLRRHVLRLRDFVDVRSVCGRSLASYSAVSPDGCEYHLGLSAVEFLVARHSSLRGVASVLARGRDFATFADWFADSFGLTVNEFVTEFDTYARAVRRESRV